METVNPCAIGGGEQNVILSGNIDAHNYYAPPKVKKEN